MKNLAPLWGGVSRQNVFSLEIKENQNFLNLLPKTKIYIDRHQTLTLKEGLTDALSIRKSVNPIFPIWNEEKFYAKEIKHQVILTLI